jgi:hypothetical protein
MAIIGDLGCSMIIMFYFPLELYEDFNELFPGMVSEHTKSLARAVVPVLDDESDEGGWFIGVPKEMLENIMEWALEHGVREARLSSDSIFWDVNNRSLKEDDLRWIAGSTERGKDTLLAQIVETALRLRDVTRKGREEKFHTLEAELEHAQNINASALQLEADLHRSENSRKKLDARLRRAVEILQGRND